MNILQPVILSGGSGTRLWPLSREKHPKQLLALDGEHTMLQATALRIVGLKADGTRVAAPIVVCNDEYRFVTAEQLRAAGVNDPTVVLEPIGRNTAPALTLAALVACRRPAGAAGVPTAQQAAGHAADQDPILLVMPADHVVRDRSAFQATVCAGLSAAQAGAIVTFGIVPDRPETGYGYIQTGPLFEGGAAGSDVPARTGAQGSAPREIARFVEKPDADTAARYVASGEYLWNSGLFMMRASVWLAAIERLAPAIAQACAKAVAGGHTDIDFQRLDTAAFEASPSDSIDYAVMEKLAESGGIRGCVVPMVAGWSDVGAWDAVWQVGEHDEHGNHVQGDAILEDTRSTLVVSTSRKVACLGISDAVVVETPDAVLVADKQHTQKIKTLVARLKAQGSTGVLENHRKVHRPWGYYDSIDSGARFQVKRIVVKPGAALSLQMHHHRAEHWVVVSGTARVTVGEKTLLLSENQSAYIPIGATHRLENPGKLELELIEVQSGSYLGEDDIVRFEDVYGRKGSGPT